MSPNCPPHYLCTFTPQQKYTVVHNIGPWWHGTGGLVVAIIAVIAAACVIAYVSYIISEARKDKRNRVEREKERSKQIGNRKGTHRSGRHGQG